jgi:tetratricopeptide (TPR) repeat protein
VEESPELAQAHKSLGDVLHRRGRAAEAAEAYRRALELDPALGADAHFKLGLLAYRRGAREEAVGHWRAALALDPGHALARTNLELVAGTLTDG